MTTIANARVRGVYNALSLNNLRDEHARCEQASHIDARRRESGF